MVKSVLLHFGSPGFAGLDPGRRSMHRSSSHTVAAAYIEELERPTTRIYSLCSGASGREKKRGRLATNVSSGPTLLTKKKRIILDTPSFFKRKVFTPFLIQIFKILLSQIDKEKFFHELVMYKLGKGDKVSLVKSNTGKNILLKGNKLNRLT